MRWRKLGRVFDPADHVLPAGCSEFAQAPQALLLENSVRVYFSTRSVDASSGLYRSHVAYAEFCTSFQRVISTSSHEVIALGKRGTFDEHGIFPMNVIRHGGSIFGYTSGVNRRVSVPVDGAIGLAVSEDGGRTFRRLGDGPVLAPSLHEPCIVVDPFVLFAGELFHMWYVFGRGWMSGSSANVPDRIYKIGHATSADGINWRKTSEGRAVVADRLGTSECQAMPSVALIDGRYHMFFCYRHASDFRTNPRRAYRIGHAMSDDLLNWTREDESFVLDPTPGDWDGDMVCYPHVFAAGGAHYLLYNGNAFGRHGFGVAVLES